MAKKHHKPTPAEINAAKVAAQKEFDRFMALPDSEKTRESEEAAQTQSRPLTPAQRAMFDELGIGKHRGRPAKGQGSRQISVTMERKLLERVDEFAKSEGLSRSQLIANGVEIAMKNKRASA